MSFAPNSILTLVGWLVAEAMSLDGYINESGKINTTRLQVVLDEMTLWEREVFEKEYADLNWYKGKQAKHIKGMEKDKQQAGLGTVFLSPPYIF